MSRTVTVTAAVEIPAVPTHLKYEGGKMDIADVGTEQLRAIGKAWTDALVETALQRRQARGSRGAETTGT